MSASHRVTIGMPVFNGERHLERAIQSVLRQSHAGFRLVILDNASTDRTAEIARRHARQDPRVVYCRNEVNLGAAPNFNRAFEHCDTEYFKWAAHDDELRPTYLEKCVRALDADPSAILAHSQVQEIDDAGNVLRAYLPVPDAVESDDRRQRFAGRLMDRGWCTEIFGVLRAPALVGTPLIASFAGSDLALIIELTLRGRFVVVREPLFLHRIHGSRYSNAVLEKNQNGPARAEIMAWYDTSSAADRSQMYWWIFFRECFRMIDRNVPRRSERVPYYLAALRWLGVRNNRFDLAKDALFAVSPTLLDQAMRLRYRYKASRRQAGTPG
jgi:glycosyltransferase involved in cell wall biosynthesis